MCRIWQGMQDRSSIPSLPSRNADHLRHLYFAEDVSDFEDLRGMCGRRIWMTTAVQAHRWPLSALKSRYHQTFLCAVSHTPTWYGVFCQVWRGAVAVQTRRLDAHAKNEPLSKRTSWRRSDKLASRAARSKDVLYARTASDRVICALIRVVLECLGDAMLTTSWSSSGLMT